MKKNEDEQRIFDSINTSGQPLANFDIVKNDLFSHFKNEKEAEKIYIEYWIPVFEKNEEIREFWDEEVLVGRDKKVRSDIFLHSFAILENIFDPSKDTLSKLKEIYKEHIEQKNEENILEFIKKFTEYAEVFKKLPFFHNEEEYAYTDTMKRFLHITHVLQLSTLVPLALYLELMFQQKKISEKNVFFDPKKKKGGGCRGGGPGGGGWGWGRHQPHQRTFFPRVSNSGHVNKSPHLLAIPSPSQRSHSVTLISRLA